MKKKVKKASKPWIDPQRKKNEDEMRAKLRKQRKRLEASIKAEQKACPHLQGSHPLSQFATDSTSIVWHLFDDGILRGICTNCSRWFLPTDKDYSKWFHKKHGNTMSTCGIPLSKDWQYPERLLDPSLFYGKDGDFRDTTAWLDSDLDSLSDLEIKKLMDKVSRKIPVHLD